MTTYADILTKLNSSKVTSTSEPETKEVLAKDIKSIVACTTLNGLKPSAGEAVYEALSSANDKAASETGHAVSSALAQQKNLLISSQALNSYDVPNTFKLIL